MKGAVLSPVLLFLQDERLSTLSPSRSGSVESLPARTQCLLSDSKRMSADFSELEPKMAFAPTGNVRVPTRQEEDETHNLSHSNVIPECVFLFSFCTPLILNAHAKHLGQISKARRYKSFLGTFSGGCALFLAF